MDKFKTLVPGLIVASALGAPLFACGDDVTGGLCCKEFQVGADMTGADLGVSADFQGQFEAFAQSAGDFSAVASGMLSEIDIACRNIAKDLGADENDPSLQGKTGRDSTTAWCDLAVARINATFGASGKFAAAGQLQINFEPIKCSASVSAQASCQGKCDVSGKCDVKANPPTCEGGKMTVSCSGSCSAEAGATIQCEGGCSGTCKGECTAEGGVSVECNGKCEGECAAGGQAGGTGIQADGSCQGTCNGTCKASATAPSVQCSGTCKGECSASCQAKAGASVKCDGKCEGEFEPLKCEGGELKGGCKVDADCEANCSANASAKAECTPPSISITASGYASLDVNAQAEFNAAIETIKVNLPNILVAFKAKGELLGKAGVKLTGASVNIAANTGKLEAKGVICAAAVAGVIAEGAANAKASLDASVKVAGSLKIN